MWEVDPETRSKLLEIQKREGNGTCCDCGAPAPQWASPKFGTFICLTCAGTHRGLGVHISFVRSISMDAFKGNEILRMEKGGNQAWKTFFETHEATKLTGVGWDECTVSERYGGDVGEEWKERLTAKVEGKEYVPSEKKPSASVSKPAEGVQKGSRTASAASSRSGTPVGRSRVGEKSTSSSSLRSSSPAPSNSSTSRKAQNEAYFARLGHENAARAADKPPNQGGKYAGFGSAPPPSSSSAEQPAAPGIDDFQKDPVAALTKGLGWFSTAVGKSAKTVNDGWIQPTAQKLAEADLAHAARQQAALLSQNITSGTKGAAESFNRFVEGGGDQPSSSTNASSSTNRSAAQPEKPEFWDSFGGAEETTKPALGGLVGVGKKSVEPEKRDFWDSFGVGDEGAPGGSAGGGVGGGASSSKPSAIGTAAMRKGGGGGGGAGTSSAAGPGGKRKDGEEWEGGEW
ncbi:MAG: Zn finger-containing GTPase- Activating Protein for ARF [Piccolia ochrophora]|nr:MAG: Zn finger-containing GTPase- Activating Protein for ARF [Piccolia ochrophora]